MRGGLIKSIRYASNDVEETAKSGQGMSDETNGVVGKDWRGLVVVDDMWMIHVRYRHRCSALEMGCLRW